LTTDTARGGQAAVPPSFFIAVALVSGAIIAFQIATMRVFSIASWAHFGSLVVSIAMFGFGVVSAVMTIGKAHFERRWSFWVTVSLLAFGPLMALANSLAQMVPFNPIFLTSDPAQKWWLLSLFVIYFLPFLPGALFLGLVFLRGRDVFGKVYFANMSGSGLGGLVFLLAMYVVLPDRLLLVPLAMWFAGAALWAAGGASRLRFSWLLGAAVLAVACNLAFTQINISPFKGVSYARAFPDSERVYHEAGPLGLVEVYQSSYFHFAPGLSDMAALNLTDMPTEAYLGMYFDGSGPVGIMRELPESQTGYFRFLPMAMPYALRENPNVFVVQLGGGISTMVALAQGAGRVTVAESNPMVLEALGDDPALRDWTGDLLNDPRLAVIPYDGRLYAAQAAGTYDIIDFSLPDSTGLSSPGGSQIFEQYAYAREAMQAYMTALAADGILSVTIWNRENPPRAVPKLFATMIEAARGLHPDGIEDHFFIHHTYLSTVTVLYARAGFTAEEVAQLDRLSRGMAFDVLYRPGMTYEGDSGEAVFAAFRDLFFAPARVTAEGHDVDMSAGNLYRLMLDHMIRGELETVRDQYVFDVRPLTNDHPYFAGYIKVADLPAFSGMLDAVSDQWGYLLLWATLGLASVFGLVLLTIPMVFGWRTIFARQPGKPGIILYFLGLGLGYIVVEIGLISKFMIALANPTISASVLITGMLVFSGVGSFFSGRFLDDCRRFMPRIFVAIATLIVVYALALDPVLEMIGAWPYALRIVACLLLLLPPAFLMGFPFATGMAMLSRLGKEHFFLWAWGINGSFSVVGAVLVPIVGVVFGLSTVLLIAAACYLMCLPAFFALLQPKAETAGSGTGQPALQAGAGE
jgi:spermidine synthase